MAQQSSISARKADHLELCASGQVDFRDKSTLLEQVSLIHQAVPDRHYDTVDLSTSLLGKRLSAPVVISGMTGGTREAESINRDIASVAQELGVAFGLGSQRAMLLHPETVSTYRVRDVAPDILVLGNLGLVQARDMKTSAIEHLCEQVGADALCIHLNPAMELVQPGGDRDFGRGYETIARLVRELPVRLVVKETGCGLSRRTGRRLMDLGVSCIDVSGAGGTSWVGVEAKRASSEQRALGDELWDWGIPTAASVAMNADFGFEIIATGGLRTGSDAARALSLGATAAGFAAPVLRAHRRGGPQGVREYLVGVIEAIRAVTFLSGCADARELRACPKVISEALSAWIRACAEE